MQPEVIYAPTQDGWQLAIHHWPAQGRPRRHPVLMVHGLGANRLNLDLDERHSVARAAAARGYAVYVLELRGAGLSCPPEGRDRALFQWGFGEYAERDLPAAIAKVIEHSGRASLHGFGHSMGGLVFFSHAVHRPSELRSITAVASPLISDLHLGGREKRLLKLAAKLAPATTQRRVPLRALSGAAGWFVPLTSRLADGILLNVANCEPEVISHMAAEGISDIPLQLVVEIMTHMANGHVPHGPYAYELKLAEVSVPVLALSGNVDRVAPAASVAALVSRLRSSDVRHREMGKKHGDAADYGHGDLLVGRTAPDEVYPLLIDFLDEVD